jgi:hypothetical protein
MEFECEAWFGVEPPLPRQHFFQFCGVIALGFYWVRERLASFFSVFDQRTTWTTRIPENAQPGSFDPG